jgi:hypothetical protein
MTKIASKASIKTSHKSINCQHFKERKKQQKNVIKTASEFLSRNSNETSILKPYPKSPTDHFKATRKTPTNHKFKEKSNQIDLC